MVSLLGKVVRTCSNLAVRKGNKELVKGINEYGVDKFIKSLEESPKFGVVKVKGLYDYQAPTAGSGKKNTLGVFGEFFEQSKSIIDDVLMFIKH